MALAIQFKKNKNGGGSIHFRRSNGSEGYYPIQYHFDTHDLAHFAVENTLQFKRAFWGLIDEGYKPADFEAPGEKRPLPLRPENLPIESLQTEFIINQLDAERGSPMATEDFMRFLKEALSAKGLPFPQTLNAIRLAEMRTHYQDLVTQWLNVSPGESLNLIFDPTTFHA